MVNSFETMDDESLLKRFVELDDREALGALFTRHAGAAYTTALRICRNQADAEDVVQSAFVNVMQNAAHYRGGTSSGVKAWLTKIVIGTVKNKIRSEVRRRKREDLVAEDSDDVVLPEEPSNIALDALAGEIKTALDGMPEDYRLAIVLHHCEGLSLQETAETMGLSTNTLSMRVKRGMKKLRQELHARGVSADSRALSAALLSMPVESAPDALVGGIGKILAGAVRVSKGAAAASGAGLSVLPARLAIVIVLAGLSLAGIWIGTRLLEPAKKIVSIAAPPAVGGVSVTNLDYHWNFNSAELPPEMKLVSGKWRHVAGGGVDGSGCIESESGQLYFALNIPADRFPILVSYRVSPVLKAPATPGDIYHSKVYWTEYNGAAEFNGISKPYSLKPGNWLTRREYVTDRFIYRWHDTGQCELAVFDRVPDAKLVLTFMGAQRIDEVRVRSIRPEDVPDASLYLRELDKIPSENRNDYLRLPHLKPGKSGGTVTVRFDGRNKLVQPPD